MAPNLLNYRESGQLLTAVEEAWSKRIKANYIDATLLRPEIAASWERCLNLDVSPYQVAHQVQRLAVEDIMENNRLLLAVAEPHMRELFDSFLGRGYMVMLYSRDGYIIRLFGDRKVVSLSEAVGVFQGANHSEASIGTFAPGICYAEGKAVQVNWYEHYREIYHSWCCSAAPIFDSRRELAAVFDITSVDQSPHSQKVLGLTKLAAQAIEAEFNYRVVQDQSQKLYCHFNTLVNANPEALVVLDDHDIITHVNRQAQKLLGVNAREMVGHNAHTMISNYNSVKCGLKAGRCLTELHFFSGSPQTVTVEAHLKESQGEGSESSGLIGVLKKIESGGPGRVTRYGFQDFIYQSQLMGSLIHDAQRMAATQHTILIQGESGTGKEVLAQAIHQASPRRDNPFIEINCAALPKELIQSELFGYESGAFTGANKAGKPGKFENAAGGTIFLDEIGDMPLEIQANLLRVLQEKCVVRVGGARTRQLDVRVIAATNKKLLREVEAGRFRSDLYYRLSVINLFIPPLRERRADIWPLIEHIIGKNCDWGSGLEEISFDRQAKTALSAYDWPGNVRELENVVIHFLAQMSRNLVTINDLPTSMFINAASDAPEGTGELDAVERRTIQATLQKCQGNISSTAKLLGISRATLYRKLKTYNLSGVLSRGCFIKNE
jgi:PAS domain S-box